jgi:hypothetical protein
MLRITLITGLSISLLLLARGIAVTLQEETAPVSPVIERQAAVAPGKPGFAFYPPVPVKLPDLNQGYIFNAARSLTHEPLEEKKEPAEPLIAVADISYIGSAISSDRRTGVIAYVEPSASFRQTPGRTRSGSQQSASKHVHLAPGDSFGGYLVVQVLPDSIVFEKDGLRIEKPLVTQEGSTSPHLQAGRRTQDRPAGDTFRPGRVDRHPVRTPASVENMRPSGNDSFSANSNPGYHLQRGQGR